MTPERWLALLARIAKILTWPFVRYDIDGGKALNERTAAAILVTDHRSLFDIAAGLILFHEYRRYPRVLVEQKYVTTKWTAPFARAIGAIPVNREAGRGEAFAAAVEALHAGETILLLPEGRLHWDPADPLSTGPASTGVSRLAEAAGLPVIPVGLVGTEKIWPADRKLPRFNPFRRRTVTARITDDALPLEGTDHRERTEQVMAAVRDLMVKAQADADARDRR